MNEPTPAPSMPPPPLGETEPPAASPDAENPYEVWLPIRPAAAFLGIGPRRLNQLRKSNDIPARKRGWKGWEFRENDLMAYVEKLAGVPLAPGFFAAPPPPPQDAAAPKSDTSPNQGDMAEMQKVMAEMAQNAPPPPPDDEEVNQAPVVRLANAILVNAVDAGASDIHIEPAVRNVRIRNRIDGTMREVMALPLAIKGPVMRRFCIMADLDPFSQRLQIGRIPIMHNNQPFNLRVSFTPTIFGPSLIIRIVDPVKLRVNRLGLTPETQRRLEDVVYPYLSGGLLLFCGPTGSGLTTTAWALLNKINFIDRKIVSLVPVVEYDLGGIAHVFVQNENGVGDVGHHRRPTVTNALSAVLRGGDPDIVFLGDITGPETARAALDAAQAGVLTLATINAPTAHMALRRIADFAGVPVERVANDCRGILVQRLVRRLNPETRQARDVTVEELARWGMPTRNATGTQLYSPVTVFDPSALDPEKSKFGYTGDQWIGRVGIFAWVTAYDAAIKTDVGRYELRRDAFAKVLEGFITVEDASVALR